MVKSNKVRLLKAVALGTTLGALFTNGSMGAEEDRREKELRKSALKAEIAGNHTEVACRVREILKGVEERKAIRRELFRQPCTFDLSVKPVGNVLNHLYGAYQASGNGSDPVKVTLNLHNVTEDQLNQILAHENAGYIGELTWTYQPVQMDAWKDAHQARFIPALMQITERKEDLSRGLKPVLPQEGRGRDGDREARVSLAKRLLGQIDERTRLRRDILGRLHTIDLGIKPVNNVLNVLYNARKYSDNDPIKVKLNLLNITKGQLNSILKDENAGYIGDLSWTYQPAVDEEQSAHQAGFIPALMQIMERGNQPLNGLDVPLYQGGEGEGGDYIEGPGEADQPMVVAVEDIEEEGNNEMPEEGRPAGPDNHVDPNVPAPRRSAARRRDAPALPELEEDFQQENNLEPRNKLVANKGAIGEIRPEDQGSPTWNITPIKEDIINPILQNLGSPNPQARQASQNLVNIYCRHVPDMVGTQ